MEIMLTVTDIKSIDFSTIPIDSFWNTGNERELLIHRIHAYPAKFPAFITTKALEFSNDNGLIANSIADIFCGCGTTAFEAKRNNIDFWGCDINPVATLIAKVKSRKYSVKTLQKHQDAIVKYYHENIVRGVYRHANPRLKYWFKREQYNTLYHLKKAILETVSDRSGYRDFFLCAFSNILKPTSVWLTKSIKPQVDPVKKCAKTLNAFTEQCTQMIKANQEIDHVGSSKTRIVTGNILDNNQETPTVDLIVTSPPYVTSYEYADLHQLSLLWLDFSDDYKVFRNGSIGSKHHDYNFKKEWKRLNYTGTNIVGQLLYKHKAKASAVAKYYLDMQSVAKKTYQMLSKKGMALFVIGNTEYKGVEINNAKHLCESLLESGFKNITVSKRKISNKILSPYRDAVGRFSANAKDRAVYSNEYIVIGRKSCA